MTAPSLTVPSLTAPSLTALPGHATVDRLDNGLTVCRVENPQAPLVTTALWFRAGARDEEPGLGGTAHFLEHMMFKGSAHYGRGEIDRRTQALGGSNNAFTSHDATAYYFNFARDRWTEALAIEADRMTGLTLDPTEVASERQVILEEIAMYENDPWDALEQKVVAKLFGEHPYGRSVLGTADELHAIGPEQLASFHRSFYRPDNAVLVVAGDVDAGALDRVREHLGAIPGALSGDAAGDAPVRPSVRPSVPASEPLPGRARVERRQGEVPRLLLALPAPAASDPSYPAVRLLAGLLASGRASRLHRSLVEEHQLCSWVMADAMECAQPAALVVATELVAGAEPERVEDELESCFRRLTEQGPESKEVDRAARMLLAEWVYEHEKIHQQALTAGFGLALFDLEHKERQLRTLLSLGPDEVLETARRVLAPDGPGVVGWSLPASRRGT